MPVKECCKNLENLGPEEPTGEPQETMRRCQVCKCRHFRLTVVPGRYEARLQKISGSKR